MATRRLVALTPYDVPSRKFLCHTEKVNYICVSDFMGTCITCIYLIIFALFSWIVPSPSLVKMLSVGFWTVLTKTTHNPNVIQSSTEHRLHKPVYPYTWRSGLTHTLKDVIFIQHWNFKSSYMQELLRVFETPPWIQCPGTRFTKVLWTQNLNHVTVFHKPRQLRCLVILKYLFSAWSDTTFW